MIPLKALYIIFIIFYAMVKIAFFVGIWIACGVIARRALAKKQQIREINRIRELELKLETYEWRHKNIAKDKIIYGVRRNKFIA